MPLIIKITTISVSNNVFQLDEKTRLTLFKDFKCNEPNEIKIFSKGFQVDTLFHSLGNTKR